MPVYSILIVSFRREWGVFVLIRNILHKQTYRPVIASALREAISRLPQSHTPPGGGCFVAKHALRNEGSAPRNDSFITWC
jgi:hypothetical protein